MARKRQLRAQNVPFSDGMTEEERLRSCAFKVRYVTEEDARDACATGIHKNCKMNTYPCRYCQGWHAGHKQKTKKLCLLQGDEFNAQVQAWVKKFGSSTQPEEKNDGP